MTNIDVFNNLNDETKLFISDILSIFDELNKYEDSNLSRIDKLAFSCFLSTLKNSNCMIDFFNKYGINYDDYKIDYEHKEANQCESFNGLKLYDLFKNIINFVKDGYYLEYEDILLNEIEPYQIFDYTIKKDSNYFSTIFCDKDFDSMLSSLNHYLYDFYNDFAKKHNVDIENEIQKEIESNSKFNFTNSSIFIDCSGAYITFNKNMDLLSVLNSVKSEKINDVYNFADSVSLPQTFRLLSVNGNVNINKETIMENIINSNEQNVLLEIKPLFSDEYYFISLNRNEAFKVLLYDEFDDEYTRNYTPFLDKYGFDMTKEEYVKDPCVGREEEIKRIEQILLYPERDKSIMIVGAAGSGKTALVKGLAYRIKNKDVPNALKNLRIISIDTSTLVAGTKYVGTLEEKMKNILDEASSSKDIVIFIDEIHQALGGGKAEGNDNSVSEILKPYIDYGKVRIIGATTDYEYSEYVEVDTAFKTRFKKVQISEPTDDIVYMVLNNLITSYNKLSENNNIICPKLDLNDDEKDMVINWLIESTKSSYRDYRDPSSNPRLVLDIIKEAYAIAAINDKTVVEIEDVMQALLLEDRLYKSSRLKQVEKLKYLKPKPKNNKIIEFKLKKF